LSGHIAALLPDSGEENDYHEELYHSDSLSECGSNVIYISDEEEEKYEVSCTENSVDHPESMASSLPCSSETLIVASNTSTNKTIEVSSVNNTATVMSSSKVFNLERTEDFSQDKTHIESTISQESEHSTLPVTVRVTEKNGCIVPVPLAETSQQHKLHTQSRTLEESQVTSASTEQYEGNIQIASCQHLSVLHPEMQQIVHLSLCKALQNYGIKLDISQLIASQAVIVVEEELKGVFRGKLLDTVLKKVAGLECDNVESLGVGVKTKEQAVSQMFQTVNEISLPAVSEEWKQIVSEIVPTLSATGEHNRERDTVDQLHFGHTQATDQATQTVSTGNVFFLKVLPD
jgi:hypothetical protein